MKIGADPIGIFLNGFLKGYFRQCKFSVRSGFVFLGYGLEKCTIKMLQPLLFRILFALGLGMGK